MPSNDSILPPGAQLNLNDPWSDQVDHVNPNFRRVYNAKGDDVLRVYNPHMAPAAARLPELLRLCVDVANGKVVTTREAASLARRCGVV